MQNFGPILSLIAFAVENEKRFAFDKRVSIDFAGKCEIPFSLFRLRRHARSNSIATGVCSIVAGVALAGALVAHVALDIARGALAAPKER